MRGKKLVSCPAEITLGVISGKWRLLILQQLNVKVNRFGELHRSLHGISEKVLAQELRDLEKPESSAEGLRRRSAESRVLDQSFGQAARSDSELDARLGRGLSGAPGRLIGSATFRRTFGRARPIAGPVA